MSTTSPLHILSDDDLLRALAQLLAQSRRNEAALVAHLAEVDARRLYARFAAPSLFAYCTEILHCSEAEAFLRIAAARASSRHPVLLDMLADGRLHLSGIERLAPHLDAPNRDDLLARAAGRTKRQIEELVAETSPRPDVPERIRKLPERRGPSPEAEPRVVRSTGSAPPSLELRLDGVAGRTLETPAPQAGGRIADRVEPLSPHRYKVQFTASASLRGKLERLQALMREARKDASLEAVLEVAIDEKLARLEAKRRATAGTPPSCAEPRPVGSAQDGRRPASRHVPAVVRRLVWARDEGRCRFVDDGGRRCTARSGLEVHHIHPFAMGGAHEARNLRLYCRTHNRYAAEVDYGRRAGRPRGSRVPPPAGGAALGHLPWPSAGSP